MTINKSGIIITIPDKVPTRTGGFSAFIGRLVLRVLGWRVTGQLPNKAKFVVAVAPHTSNWDFVVAISAMLAMKLSIRFMAKKALFIWPFNYVLKSWGGIAIDRTSKHGIVKQMVYQSQQCDKFVLGIAPEGTRQNTHQWKSGFLYIANQAEIPVVPLSLDFEKKELRFHPAANISSDIDAELIKFKLLFSNVCAKNTQAV